MPLLWGFGCLELCLLFSSIRELAQQLLGTVPDMEWRTLEKYQDQPTPLSLLTSAGGGWQLWACSQGPGTQPVTKRRNEMIGVSTWSQQPLHRSDPSPRSDRRCWSPLRLVFPWGPVQTCKYLSYIAYSLPSHLKVFTSSFTFISQ